MKDEAKHWRAWAMAALDLEPGGAMTMTDSELRGLIELDLTTEWERANAAEDEIARLRDTEIRLRELLRRAEASAAENMRLALARDTKSESLRATDICVRDGERRAASSREENAQSRAKGEAVLCRPDQMVEIRTVLRFVEPDSQAAVAALSERETLLEVLARVAEGRGSPADLERVRAVEEAERRAFDQEVGLCGDGLLRPAKPASPEEQVVSCEPAKNFPVCGAWHDHYNRCEQPAGHAGDHVFDRLRWARGGGGDGLLRPAKPASSEEQALAVARVLHRAFDDANMGKEPLHNFDVTLECGVRDNWVALGQKAIELGAAVKGA